MAIAYNSAYVQTETLNFTFARPNAAQPIITAVDVLSVISYQYNRALAVVGTELSRLARLSVCPAGELWKSG